MVRQLSFGKFRPTLYRSGDKSTITINDCALRIANEDYKALAETDPKTKNSALTNKEDKGSIH
jgi:hypothetical protein